ncbi:MAG: non-heme iron oxygenase ferredoxin subunit [Methylococcaceae bacterium]|nr:non-heme iron oxygenase ferredoxin subunit [Methylococcaceae bacterium]
MSDWIDAIPTDDLAEGGHVVVEVEGVEVAIFRIEGAFYAVQDVCTHDGAEIGSGDRVGCEIICPRHGARFCLKTGKVLQGPAYEDLPIFPLRVEDGIIQVRDDRWD